jgi:membrane-associated phospholipid phosphatase
MNTAAALLLISALALPPGIVGQTPEPETPPSQTSPAGAPVPQIAPPAVPAPQPAADDGRPVSWKTLATNIASDQRRIWLFPLTLGQESHWIPAASVVGATAGLVALDPYDAPYFRHTSSFSEFNKIFSGSATSYGMIAAPVSFYLIGLARKNSKMQKTALLAGEAVADSEILTTVLKDATKRVRPAAIGTGQSYSDTWFDSKGPILRGNGSMPSGHTIAAMSIATVIARRYGNHRWVPFVAYGLAGVIGFSRVSLSAHFVSDVFMGGALGYSISRFAVLQQ